MNPHEAQTQTLATCLRNERDWSSVTPRLRTEKDIVIEQPLRSTVDGKDKVDFGGLIKIISDLYSLSFNSSTLIQNFNREMHD